MSDDTLNQWDFYALQDCIKALTKERDYWKDDSAAGWDKCEENRVKLAVAVEALEYIKETLSLYSAKEALAKIKSQGYEFATQKGE